MSNNLRKNKFWSQEDISKLVEFIDLNGEKQGIKLASAHFKVSRHAIYGRLYRLRKKMNDNFLKNNPKGNKVPIVRKSPKKQTSDLSCFSVDIKRVEVDLKNNKLNIYY